MSSVQAFILNQSYQKEFEQITQYVSNVENIISCIENENGLVDGWSTPRWANVGDIAFFMMAKTTTQLLSKHTRTLYNLGSTNMSFQYFKWLLDMACINKVQGDDLAYNAWMIYPENMADKVELRTSGFKEMMLLEDVSFLKEVKEFNSFIPFKTRPWIAIDESQYQAIKEYVFNHRDDITYYWTDYEMAIPVIWELVLNREYCQKYGGKIFAIGVVNSIPEIDINAGKQGHWRIPIYANYSNVTLLSNPIDISEFRDFITVSRQGTVTPVLGDSFHKLKNLILKNNTVFDGFRQLNAVPVTLAKMTEDNWLSITKEFRRKFTLESQFRAYYVDWFLRHLCNKRYIYRECICFNKTQKSHPRVDNTILIGDKYLPVEVKLNVKIEHDILKQCASYCDIDKCELKSGLIVSHEQLYKMVMVIDTSYIYLYKYQTNGIERIADLDEFITNGDIAAFVKSLTVLLEEG